MGIRIFAKCFGRLEDGDRIGVLWDGFLARGGLGLAVLHVLLFVNAQTRCLVQRVGAFSISGAAADYFCCVLKG
jgi:hypothetical protein